MAAGPGPHFTESLPAVRLDAQRVKIVPWVVEVSSGPDKGKRFETLERLVRVGTDSGSDLVLTDPTVSRRHVELERVGEGYRVRDLGSRNGTLLREVRVLEAIAAPKDKITLGKTRLQIREQKVATEVELASGQRFGELFGASEAMRAAFALLEKVAGEQFSVLLEGETGTGKELAARAVHAHSSRRQGPFKVVDCSLLTEETADRELLPRSPGEIPALFASALGGTLFLDELCELPVSVQPRLLRSLETYTDVRVIASSNRNVDEELRQQRLRKDLFFRVAVARVRLPPLRARREELPLLAGHLLAQLGVSLELGEQTLTLFERYDWPGNVRELRNVLERGALMQDAGSTSWLDFITEPLKTGPQQRWVGELLLDLPYHAAKDRVVGDFERIYFAEVMKACGFDMQRAEEKTGLSMQSLYRLIKKNGLRLKDLKNAEGLER
jgi:two-component system, NtrC family, response regulator GlrR